MRAPTGQQALTAALARAPLRQHGWRDALARLRDQVGAAGAALLHVDRSAGRVRLRSSGADPEAERRYLDLCGADPEADPRLVHACAAPLDQVWTQADLPAEACAAVEALQARIGGPVAAGFVRAVTLARDGGDHIILATLEPAADASGREAAAAAFEAALPAVRHALEIEQALHSESRQRAAQLAAALQAPAIILAPDARVLEVTEAADALLGGGGGLRRDGRRLVAASPEVARALHDAVSQAAREDQPRGSLLRAEDGLVVRVAPLPRSPRFAVGGHAAVALLLARLGPERRLDALARRARLTPAESDIVRMLVEGLSAEEIADRRQASRETVRTQLKSIYAKTGSASRADLLRAYYGAAAGED